MMYSMNSQKPIRIGPFVIDLFAVKWWWLEVRICDRPTLMVGVFTYNLSDAKEKAILALASDWASLSVGFHRRPSGLEGAGGAVVIVAGSGPVGDGGPELDEDDLVEESWTSWIGSGSGWIGHQGRCTSTWWSGSVDLIGVERYCGIGGRGAGSGRSALSSSPSSSSNSSIEVYFLRTRSGLLA